MTSSPFIGHIDAIENGEIYGWAINVGEPAETVKVGIYLDGSLATEVLAGYYRPDVAQALSCTGRHGFYVDLSALCRGSRRTLVDVRFPNGKGLEGGPLRYKAAVRSDRSRRPTLLFMHIPKTAGTAFREVILRNYRQSEVMYIYGDPPGFPTTFLGDLPIQQRSSLRLVYGHYGYGVHRDMPVECEYAALIRDPLARVCSHYSHLLRDRSAVVVDSVADKGIEEVLEARESIHLDNLYVRYFCGINEGDLPPGSITRDVYEKALHNALQPNVFLRAQEDLVSAYDSLAQERGWIRGLKCDRMNVSPQRQVPSAKEIKAIQHFNQWDFRLYEQVFGVADVAGVSGIRASA
jgi:hypothetical protein